MNLGEAIRTAILENSDIPALLGTYQLVPAVFTRRPIPQEAAAFPCIVINPDVSVTDTDLLSSVMPVIVKDIAIYGNQPKDYRDVESLGWLIRNKFHRQPKSISVDDYSSVMITATGPIVGPTDDESRVARIVTLTVTLHRR